MMASQVWRLSGNPIKWSLPKQAVIGLSFLALLQWVYPQAALAQSLQAPNTPKLAFEIKHENQTIQILHPAFLAQDMLATTSVDKLTILKSYLAEKNSPLQDYAEVLLLQPNWKYILAISHAESNMCVHQLGNNCWGIGGAKYHRYYPSFAQGIVDASVLIQKYHDGGLDTTKKMMQRWVGWNNQSWVVATQNVFEDLRELGI